MAVHRETAAADIQSVGAQIIRRIVTLSQRIIGPVRIHLAQNLINSRFGALIGDNGIDLSLYFFGMNGLNLLGLHFLSLYFFFRINVLDDWRRLIFRGSNPLIIFQKFLIVGNLAIHRQLIIARRIFYSQPAARRVANMVFDSVEK